MITRPGLWVACGDGLKIKKLATNHLWTHGNLKIRVYEAIDGILFNGFDKVVAVSEAIE